MGKKIKFYRLLMFVLWLVVFAAPTFGGAAAAGTSFTYQGQLSQGGSPANGDFDFVFNLFDGPDPLVDNEIASQVHLAVSVTEGLFFIELDFGSGIFEGAGYWLEIEVRPAGGGGTTSLFPLQKITRTPYAIDADTIDGIDSSVFLTAESDPTVQENVKDGVEWSELGGVPSDIADGDDVGLTSESDPTVDPSVKDGIAWAEISNIPSGFADGLDNTNDADSSTSNEIQNLASVLGQGNTGASISLTGTMAANKFDLTASSDVFRTEITGFGRYRIVTPEAEEVYLNQNGNLGIGVIPAVKLHVAGKIRLTTLGSAGSSHLCWNSSNAIASCSSSIRYKYDVVDLDGAIEWVKNLRPVAFKWKDTSSPDLGFVAEEVAEIDSSLVTHDRNGQIEGVKYDRLTAVLVNAIKEQQNQIDRLEAVVCLDRPKSDLCN